MRPPSNQELPGITRSIVKRRWAVAVLTLLLFGSVRMSAAADILNVAGSTAFTTTIMKPHQKEIEAATGLKLNVLPNKTDLGIKLLLEGRADVAMISTRLDLVIRSLTDAPNSSLDQLKAFDVYRSAVAFAVHPSNRVKSVSVEQLRKVLLGTFGNWRDLGGVDLPIKIVMVDSGAGIPLTLETQLLEGKAITVKDPIKVRISSQVAKVVEQEPAALGLAQANNIPGHKVTTLTVPQPIEQALSYVTLGEPSLPVRSLIDATKMIMSKE